MTATVPCPTTNRRLRRRVLQLVIGLAAAAGAALALGAIGAPSASAATCLPVFAQPFTDVPHDHPFCNEIRIAKVHGAVGGYPDGSFHPTESVTRGQVAATLWNAATAEDGGTLQPCPSAPYLDVPADHIFCWQIAVIGAVDIMHGFSDGTFRPSQAITRQEMAATLVKFPEGPLAMFACDEAPFVDVPAWSDFCSAILLLVDTGVVNGYADGTFKPHIDIPRQEFVAMLVRWIEFLDD